MLYRAQVGQIHPIGTIDDVVLEQQMQALAALVDAAERGALLNFRHVLVVVDQAVVQDLLRAALPIEGRVGAFWVRLESAVTTFDDGLALVHLNGRASLAAATAGTDLHAYGGVEVVGVDSTSGLLRCQVRVFAVEIPQRDTAGASAPLRGLAEALGQGGLAALLRVVEIPVRIDDHVALPAVNLRRLRIAAVRVPIRVSVAEVKVFAGKLWVSLSEHAPAAPAGRP